MPWLCEERAIVRNSTAPTSASVYVYGYKLEDYVNRSSFGSNGCVPRLALGWRLVFCFALLVTRSPPRAILCLRRSSNEVDALYLDSVMETLSLPAHLDPVLGVVQSSILDECRWPLRFTVRALASAVVINASMWRQAGGGCSPAPFAERLCRAIRRR